MKQKYRGYEIELDRARGWLIYLDGEFVCAQPSEEFAYSWVNQELRKLAAEAARRKTK